MSTPNMNLNLPKESADNDIWGTKLNTALSTVDAHDHTTDSGVKISVSSIDFNADIELGGYATNNTNTASLKNNSTAQTTLNDTRSLQVINGDLYYVNGAQVAIKITDGNNIVVPANPDVPAGTIFQFAGIAAPSGYLVADGTSVPIASFPALFAAIGYAYGGAGANFNLPDYRGRTSIGEGTYTDPVSGSVTRTLAQNLGAEKHLLTYLEGGVGSHIHFTGSGNTSTNGNHQHALFTSTLSDTVLVFGGDTSNVSIGTYLVLGANTDYRLTRSSFSSVETALSFDSGNHSHSWSGTDTGASANATDSHNNMQPSLILNFIIKT